MGVALYQLVADADGGLPGEVEVTLHHQHAGLQGHAEVGVADGLPHGELRAVLLEGHGVGVHLVAPVVGHPPGDVLQGAFGQLGLGGRGVLGGHLYVVERGLVAVLGYDVGEPREYGALALVDDDLVVSRLYLEGGHVGRVLHPACLLVVGQLEVPARQLPALEVDGEGLLRYDGVGVEVEPGELEVPDGVLLVDGVALVVRPRLYLLAGAVEAVLEPRPHVAYLQLRGGVDVVVGEDGGEYLAGQQPLPRVDVAAGVGGGVEGETLVHHAVGGRRAALLGDVAGGAEDVEAGVVAVLGLGDAGNAHVAAGGQRHGLPALAAGEVEGVRGLVRPPLGLALGGNLVESGEYAARLGGDGDGGGQAVGELHLPLLAGLVPDGLLHHVHRVGGASREVPVHLAGLHGLAVLLVGVEGEHLLAPRHDAGLELGLVAVLAAALRLGRVRLQQGVTLSAVIDVSPGGQCLARRGAPGELHVVRGHQLLVDDGLLGDDGSGYRLARY